MSHTLDYALSEELQQAIHIAQAIAKEHSHAEFGPSHLLLALLHKDVGLVQRLEAQGEDIYYLEEWAEVRLESLDKVVRLQENIPGDGSVESIFYEADNLRLKLKKETIDPVCLLASLSTPGVGYSYEQLKTFPLKPERVLESVVAHLDLQNAISPPLKTNGQSPESATALLKFTRDKSAQARTGQLDKIIGRDQEIKMMAEILGRRSKPNVIITGEPGVGKTALVDGFVQEIVAGRVPENLKPAQVLELDFSALLAGASYKGEAEDRLRKVIGELSQFDRPVLFIDEIHAMMDQSNQSLVNLLKPELARGTFTLIGATTVEEYRKHIEKDEAFKRRLEVVKLQEPEPSLALKMIEGVVPYYEEHHNLKMGKEAMAESVQLAKRYVKEKRLPDAAIDLIDRTMSATRMMLETSHQELQILTDELKALLGRKPKLSEPDLLEELRWFHRQLKAKVSYLLLGQLEAKTDPEKITKSKPLIAHLNKVLKQLGSFAASADDKVTATDLAASIAYITGIPIGKIQAEERERLMQMDDHLKKRVVGQDHALSKVAEAIMESRSGLNKPGQPTGSFFFLGPTGTGKTELAKTLAEFLFQTEEAMIRFDMSEFKEEHSAALLYGAPPGYVGYEEGGMLVNKIRQQPYAVVLFDEIEKAHPSVFDIFLQIMDEGKLHDRLGKEGDFSNALVLFTSNIGSEHIIESFASGKIPESKDLLELMSSRFRPEFLGRLTEIIPFAPISEEVVLKIFDIQLKHLLLALEKQDIGLKLSAKARKFLAQSGHTPQYGARPLAGVIRSQVRGPLSRMIVSGKVKSGDTANLDMDAKGGLKWKISKKK